MWFEDSLACPDCAAALTIRRDSQWACACGFTAKQAQPLDLRPVAPVPRVLKAVISSRATELLKEVTVERPVRSYEGPIASRDSSELFSALSPADLRAGGSMLDLGCGPRDQAPVARHLGLRYVGLDYASTQADVLADAHALPFQAASFDLAFSYAVLEHLYNPFLATREIARVLKPGGVFVGTVSQGEPFHDSYFHHTAWGLLQVCEAAGLQVERIWYSYDTLRALAVMGRYPRLGRILIRMIDRLLSAVPMLSPRKYFRWSHREREIDALHRAASICFVARRAG
jgi:SAM-dependent methyltransferase